MKSKKFLTLPLVLVLIILVVVLKPCAAGSLEPYLFDTDTRQAGEVASVNVKVDVVGNSFKFGLEVSYRGKHGFGSGTALYGYYNPKTQTWSGFGRWMKYETRDYTTPVVPITKIRYYVDMRWESGIKRTKVSGGEYEVSTVYRLKVVRKTDRPGDRWDSEEVLINGRFKLAGLTIVPNIKTNPIEAMKR